MIKLIGIVLVGVYIAGIWKFWKGYNQTNFNPSLSNRITLSLLWPVLVFTNPSYRKNFQKALKSKN